MMPSPSELTYFLEVANTLNISRAAERLGISQPTLSIAIKRLEDSIGTPLMIRSKSGIKLSHAGQKLVSQVRTLINEWDRLKVDTLKDEDEIRGRYTIGCHPSVALYSLPPVLPKLLQENPFLDIKLVHDLSRKITEDVISFKIDFGIVVNPWEHPDLIIRPLCRDTVTLWTSKKPSELQNPKSEKAVLICDPELIQSQSLLKQLSKSGYHFKRTITSGSLEAIASLVASRSGIGILPGRVASRIKSYDIKPLSDNAPTFQDKIALIYRTDAQKSKASRTMARSIEAYFKPD